jgi:Helicase C-terminal domain
VGRCIRHKGDYGAILLLDHRFTQPGNQERLSRWWVQRTQCSGALPETTLWCKSCRMHANKTAALRVTWLDCPRLTWAMPNLGFLTLNCRVRGSIRDPQPCDPTFASLAAFFRDIAADPPAKVHLPSCVYLCFPC